MGVGSLFGVGNNPGSGLFCNSEFAQIRFLGFASVCSNSGEIKLVTEKRLNSDSPTYFTFHII